VEIYEEGRRKGVRSSEERTESGVKGKIIESRKSNRDNRMRRTLTTERENEEEG
jgi:hypothetical protein